VTSYKLRRLLFVNDCFYDEGNEVVGFIDKLLYKKNEAPNMVPHFFLSYGK